MCFQQLCDMEALRRTASIRKSTSALQEGTLLANREASGKRLKQYARKHTASKCQRDMSASRKFMPACMSCLEQTQRMHDDSAAFNLASSRHSAHCMASITLLRFDS